MDHVCGLHEDVESGLKGIHAIIKGAPVLVTTKLCLEGIVQTIHLHKTYFGESHYDLAVLMVHAVAISVWHQQPPSDRIARWIDEAVRIFEEHGSTLDVAVTKWNGSVAMRQTTPPDVIATDIPEGYWTMSDGVYYSIKLQPRCVCTMLEEEDIQSCVLPIHSEHNSSRPYNSDEVLETPVTLTPYTPERSKGLQPPDLLRDLVQCADRGTVHMQHSEGKSTLTMSHVGDVHKYLLSELWPSLESFVQTYARFAAYLRAQGDTTRERVSQAWTHPIHDIKVKQDALTGLLDAYYRKVFRSHQPKGRTQFDVAVGAPDSLTPSVQIRADYDQALRLNNILEHDLLWIHGIIENAQQELANVIAASQPTQPGAPVLLSGLPLHEDIDHNMARWELEDTLYELKNRIRDMESQNGVPTDHPDVCAASLVSWAAVLATTIAVVTSHPNSNPEEEKSRHKWFGDHGIHLKDIRCQNKLSTGNRSKVFQVRHKSGEVLVVKEVNLTTTAHTADPTVATPLGSRESELRITRYCTLWERLYQDISILTYLVCPTDVFFKSNKLKVVMPFMPDRSLADVMLMSLVSPHPVLHGATVAKQILIALAALHELGIPHGTLSLANVLATSTGRILLNDVGIHALFQGDNKPSDFGADLAAVGEIAVMVEMNMLSPNTAMAAPHCPPIVMDFVAKCKKDGVTIQELLQDPYIQGARMIS